VSVTRLLADTEGPRPGPHCWVVAGGVSAHREWRRASAEWPLTRRAKRNASRSQRKRQDSRPAGKKSRHAVTKKDNPLAVIVQSRVSSRPMSENPPLTVAVVGVGHLGRHHLRLARTLPGWRCVGAFDPDRSRLEAMCAEFGAEPLASLEEAVARAEAAVIASPTVTHREVAERFLLAGRHVMVEKPIAATVAEARELVALARRQRLILGVGHVEYFNPAVQAVLARGPRPRYLEAQRLSPFTRRSMDIDVVLDLMVHDIQLAQAVNGGSPLKEVRAVGVPVLSERVDLANVRLEFATGCVANLTASRVSSERVRKLRLFEPDAYHSIDYADQTVSAYRLVRAAGETSIAPLDVRVDKAEPLAVEHLAFQRACRGEGGPFVDGEAGTAALAAAVAVVDAIATANS
jgi:predicted dehydrogenase